MDEPSLEELAPLFPGLELESVLGRGGMGVVYKARQRDLDRHVALKVLSSACTSDPAFAERFEREARVLARLSHPHVVQIFDAGRTGERYWLMMEYVDGVNLRRLIEQREVSPRESLTIVTQICDALQFAHDEGVVHRDIKPENILVDRSGRVKIADFGLAKLVERETGSVTLTRSDQAMGTPQYMAPEQIRKPLAVDHRADIYSLGVVLYELLTGDLPMGNFPLPSDRVGIDVRLDEVVLKSLEREPERRYQHASDVKVDVQRASSASLAGVAASAGAAASSGAPEHERERHGHGEGRRSRHTSAWTCLGLGCLVLLLLPALLLAFYGMSRNSSHQAVMEAEMAQRAQMEALKEAAVAEEALQLRQLQTRGREHRARHELLALRGVQPSGVASRLYQLADEPHPDVEVLRPFVDGLRDRYLKVESANLLSHNLVQDGGSRVVIGAFTDELIELEQEFLAGLESLFPQAGLTEVEYQSLLMEAFPFGWSQAMVQLQKTEDGWSWSERFLDDEGKVTWESSQSGPDLPPRLKHLAELPGAPGAQDE